MKTLEQRVEDALLDRDPRESEFRVKETVADALSTFDPSATVKVTSYFNHTFAPDIVLSWGKAERPVFLRFTDNLPELGEDIELLDRKDPLMFGLSTPPIEGVQENRLDERTRAADILLTTPAAVDELSARVTPAATDRMLRNSLAHGGRGALVGKAEANRLADSFDTGFTAASRGQVEATRLALTAIGDHFAGGQARRLNRVVQAVWEGGGSGIDQYPGDPDLAAEVSNLSLIYLLQYMDTANPAFWRGVGRALTLDQLVALAHADAAGLNNFQHLVNANLDVLRARACLVLDMSMYDNEEPLDLSWAVDLPVRDAPPALTLRGPGFHAFVTRKKEDLKPRLSPSAGGLSVTEFLDRTATAHVAAVNASVGDRHISLSDDSGTTDTDFVQAATSGLPDAQVDRATVSTPSGRITVDFAQRTGTGVTRSDTLVVDLLLATTSLLVDFTAEQREALTAFLTITTRAPATTPETLNFNENDADHASPARE
ncbi:hypothetical protein [Raineyella sp. W15-4]|uniref:hypothetical protein n=1 Tax=Raineyella sp. W15-4 TaxID=3081651 RepID=UPI0029540A11|nr:hypothetical protein [Raineyella sp. W15-4]WOQ17585.1 hypothetical protein R0145_02400 [Raineyella sp. W15-4]